jgi:hypothetical protein
MNAPVAAGKPRKFGLTCNFHVGEVVTGVARTQEGYQINWYQTIGGMLGALMTFSSTPDTQARIVRMVKVLDLEMAALFFKLTKCDRVAFRNKFYPSSVIDLDMCELFLRLSDARKAEVVEKLRIQCPVDPARNQNASEWDVRSIEREIATICSYFFTWGAVFPDQPLRQGVTATHMARGLPT